jgi:glutamyl-tRNA synthetase
MGLDPEAAEADWTLLAPNLDRLSDLRDWSRILRDGPDPAALEQLSEEDRAYAAEAARLLPPRPWDETTWGAWTAACKAATGRKGAALFRPLRVLLTGRRSGPEMAALMPRLRGPVPTPPEG